MWDNPAIAVAVASLIINIIVLLVGLTWKLSRLELALREAINSSRSEIDERLDSSVREFAETAMALRQKINEVELWARDNFVRRDGFYKVRDDLAAEIKSLAVVIDRRMERLEVKIDEARGQK